MAAAWAAAALTASIGASVVSTQQVLAGLVDVGAKISIGDRLLMTISDLAILQTLFPLMAVCFLVGFIVAMLCNRFIGGINVLWFFTAGASSIVCTLLLMSWVMNLMPIAGARTTLGMILISVCGGTGGLVFTWLNSDNSVIDRNSKH